MLKFLLSMLGLLLLIGPTAGAADGIPGTRWKLERPATWSLQERSAIEELVTRLPVEYRSPRRPVRIRRSAAPPLFGAIDDSTAPVKGIAPSGRHTIARANRVSSTITLYVDGLEAQAAPVIDRLSTAMRFPTDLSASARFYRVLIQRQLVHELTHLVDDERGWSQSHEWRQIAGWSLFSSITGMPPDHDPQAFASRYGMKNPAEDLATFAEIYFLPPIAGPLGADEHPRCRLKQRWEFLRTQTGPHPDPAPNVHCAALEDIGLDPTRIEQLELAYVAPAMTSVASIAGHLLVVLKYRPDAHGNIRRDAYALTADPAGTRENSYPYIIKGLTGGFYSRIERAPYQVFMLRYSELEDRDLRRYRLKLTGPQLRSALERLDELQQHGKRPYFFFSRNCTQLVLDLLAPSLGADLRLPVVASPDMVMARLSQLDLLEPLSLEYSQEIALPSRARQALHRRREVAELISRLAGEQTPELMAALSRIEQGGGAELKGYEALQRIVPSLEADPALYQALDVFLALSHLIARAQVPRGHRTDPSLQRSPGAWRSAVESLHTAAGPAASSPVTVRQIESELIHAVRADRAKLSRHTPFRRISLGPTLSRADTRDTLSLNFSSVLFAPELGDQRQFNLSEGLEVTVLETEAALGISPASRFYGRSTFLRGLWLPLRNERWLTGWAFCFADLEVEHDRATSIRATWLSLSRVLNLWQADGLRNSLRISGGAVIQSAVDTHWLPGVLAPEFEPVALGLPVRLDLRLGSRRDALTTLRAGLEASPRVTALGLLRQRWEATGSARLRLGEVAGMDVALGLQYRGVRDATLAGEDRHDMQTLKLGIWLERF